MPLNFPSSPSLNDTYSIGDRTYRYNGEAWDLVLGLVSRMTVDSVAPDTANANPGDFWISSDTGNHYILVADSDSRQWVELATNSAGTYQQNVLSVNGLSGDVVLTTANISENTNLYFSNARAFANLLNATTTSLAEGSNLYFTNSRAISALTGNNISIAANGLLTANVVGGVTSVGGSTGAVSNAVLLSSISGVNNSSTSYFSLPAGSREQRPANPQNGSMRWNTSNSFVEYFFDNTWYTVTSYSTAPYNVEILLVGGGGGGGGAGGGGGGGVVSVSSYTVNPGTSYGVTAGAGGTSMSSPGSTTSGGHSGSNTIFYSAITAAGGGGGAGYNTTAMSSGSKDGGSGGGGGHSGGAAPGGVSTQSGLNAGVPNLVQYGYGGGSGQSANYTAGGGGGAGGSGGNSSGGNSGAGGPGFQSSITGTSYYWGGGGGGGNQNAGAGGNGVS